MFPASWYSLDDARDKLRRWRQQVGRRLAGVDRQVVRLEPEGTPRGRVLFSYILDPFLEAEKDSPRHTQVWESWTMGETWRQLGFAVDCVSWRNPAFRPTETYDFVIDVRTQLEVWAPLQPQAIKVLHIDTGHYSYNNAAHAWRQAWRQTRRGGPTLDVRKDVPINRGIESADCGTVLGNRFTQGTYAFAGKPLRHVPVSVPYAYERPLEAKFHDPQVRRSFVWFGSEGLVHKGLDLVLEAFAGMPELHLAVCGPIRRERQFLRAYERELYGTPNITTLGWVDVKPAAFGQLAQKYLGLVYPSCCEGGGASALTCQHAGLIPVLTPETSVDLEPNRGILLRSLEVEAIRAAVRELAAKSPAELHAMALAGWEWARSHHGQELFREAYHQAVLELIDGRWRQWPVPAPLDRSQLSAPVEPRFASREPAPSPTTQGERR